MSASAPSNPYVVNYSSMRLLDFPVSGAGSNIPVGTPMIPGVTAGTNVGVWIPTTATSTLGLTGLLAEPHIYSGTNSSGDALTQTLGQWFAVGAGNNAPGGTILGVASVSGVGGPYPSHRFDLIDTFTGIKLDYAISDASSVAVTSVGSTTVINNATATGSNDSMFLYFWSGTAIGQIGFVSASSNTTSVTLISALTTAFATSDKFITINALGYGTPKLLINSTTAATKIDASLAVGTCRLVNMANFISTNSRIERLDPKIHHKMSGLNSLAQLGFFSYVASTDSIFHPVA